MLVRCLSSTSATVSRLNSGQYIGDKDKANLVVGPRAVDAAFDAMFNHPNPKK